MSRTVFNREWTRMNANYHDDARYLSLASVGTYPAALPDHSNREWTRMNANYHDDARYLSLASVGTYPAALPDHS